MLAQLKFNVDDTLDFEGLYDITVDHNEIVRSIKQLFETWNTDFEDEREFKEYVDDELARTKYATPVEVELLSVSV